MLNTDNMSIFGLTIDYGPYGFLDRYNPDHIFNGSGKKQLKHWPISAVSKNCELDPKDTGGRYTLRNQPDICKWNCLKLSEALHPVLDKAASKAIVERVYDKEFKEHYMEKMRKKVPKVRHSSSKASRF